MKVNSLKNVAGAHNDGIWAAAWAPATASRAGLLITGSVDETVKLWKGDELECERTNTGHSLGVVAVAAHPGGTFAASTSLDSFVRVFDIDSNATVATLETPPSEAWLMQFDPKGDLLAVAGGGSCSVKIWNTSTWRMEQTLPVPKTDSTSDHNKASDKTGLGKFVLAVAWSHDGKTLACSTMDGTVAIFDVAKGKLLHTLEGHNMPVRSLVFSPVDANLLFTGSDDKHIHMYDAKSRVLVSAFSGHASWVLSVDASPDGAALASGSSDKTVRLWDLKMRAAVQTMTDHSDQVWAVAFRPSSGEGVRAGRLASVSDDKSVSLYEYA
jgi:WD repeat-containing protein 61